MAIEVDGIDIDVDQVKELYTAMSGLVYGDMDKQYKEKKINGSTYADTWAELMKAVVAGSMQTVASLQMKETDADRCIKNAQCDEIAKKSAREECLAAAECALKTAQTAKVDYETSDILPTQKALSVRQTEGFDDNLRQKLFEAQMNAWAMMFSSGLLETMPCFIASDEASKLYGGILEKDMPTYTKPTDPECCAKSGGKWDEANGVCTFPDPEE